VQELYISSRHRWRAKFSSGAITAFEAMDSEKEMSVGPTKINDKGPSSITRVPCDIHGKHTFNVAGQHFCVSTRYQLMTIIGVGAYGTVVAAIDRETKHRVAIKRVGSLFEDIVDAKRILREIRLMRFLQHPNVRQGRAASGCPTQGRTLAAILSTRGANLLTRQRLYYLRSLCC
jgi:serine/threonine protein kinase